MIPEAYITEWSNVVPWQSNEQVEQDLVISRVLVEIFNDDILSKKLAFRGGTALHKLFLQQQSRYSEDIDLVQIDASPIGEVLDRLRSILSFFDKVNIKRGDSMVTMRFRFTSEIPPVVPMKLKVETNGRENFVVLGYTTKPFTVNSRWFEATANVVTYSINELLGTKLRALYQRSKGRDLFDLYKAMFTSTVDPEQVVKCYFEYMKHAVGKAPSKEEYNTNLSLKMKDPEFHGDIKGLLRPDERYDPGLAYELISRELIGRM
jgi:predicted nucleotidyltransferase component of viral defense system